MHVIFKEVYDRFRFLIAFLPKFMLKSSHVELANRGVRNGIGTKYCFCINLNCMISKALVTLYCCLEAASERCSRNGRKEHSKQTGLSECTEGSKYNLSD